MIPRFATKWILGRLFGSGPVADVAARGVTYLGHELRESVAKGDQPVTKVRLQLGETYTVISRPKPTKHERKLAKKQTGLVGTYKDEIKASKGQVKAARRLRQAQRRLNRVSPETGRYEKRAAKERRRAIDFDRIMRPSKKQVRTAQELDRVSRELDSLREQHLSHARRATRPRRRVTVFD